MRAVWVALLVAGCGGKSAPRGGGAPAGLRTPLHEPEPAIVPGEFVLVRRDAWIASDVGDDAPRFRMMESAPPGRAYLFRAVASDGDVVQIETITSDDASSESAPHCESRVIDRLDVYRLRLFVRRGDVLRVTARPFAAEYADGTAIGLAGGVALAAPTRRVGGALVYTAQLPDAALEVALPEGAVARSYAARGPQPRAAAVSEAPWSLRKAAVMQVGGLDVQALEPLDLVDRRQLGARVLATIEPPCALARGLAARGDLELRRGGTLTTGGGWGEGCSHAYDAKVGIKVYWADGRVAGEVLEQHQLCGNLSERGNLQCYRRVVEQTPEISLEVCFDQKDL